MAIIFLNFILRLCELLYKFQAQITCMLYQSERVFQMNVCILFVKEKIIAYVYFFNVVCMLNQCLPTLQKVNQQCSTHPSDHFFFLISGERCFYLPSQERHSCLKNHIQKLSTVAHDITLYRASTGPDFLFAYSMLVLHLTYKMLNVSSTRTFLLIEHHCKAIKVYNLLLFC